MPTLHQAAKEARRPAFERWARINGYDISYVRGGEAPEGGPVYDDPRTHAAWHAYLFALSALSCALEEAEKVEAVAWLLQHNTVPQARSVTLTRPTWDTTGFTVTPLYATPAQPPAAQEGTVARLVREFYDGTAEKDWPMWADEAVNALQGICAAPGRVPLSEEQIILATEDIDIEVPGCFFRIARAIEAAHGITAQPAAPAEGEKA